MGGFLLVKKHSDIILTSALKIFTNKGFKEPNLYNFGDYDLFHFKKIKTNVNNYYINNDNYLFACGTLIYKKYDYEDSLKFLLDDFINDKHDLSDIKGIFTVFLNINNKYLFLTDRSNCFNIYYDTKRDIISSSFLAVSYGVNDFLTLNKLAVIETLITGNLIPPDTLFNEVKRYTKKDVLFKENIEKLNYPVDNYCHKYSSFSEAVEHQNDILKNYFFSIQQFADKNGLLSGLTGGLDSRLLFTFVVKYLNNYSFFSTWKKYPGAELLCAKQICDKFELPLLSPQYPILFEYSEENTIELLNDNYYFNDGLIRTHQLWIEYINSKEYRINLLKDFNISFIGVGGEQYRNNEKISPFGNYSIYNWFFYNTVFKYCGNPFINKTEKNIFMDYYIHKIFDVLSKDTKDKRIDYLGIKKYYNEVYNISNRTLRSNIENQAYYSLSPFTEYEISHSTYNIISYLGFGFNFEINMMKNNLKKVVDIPTDYGYSIKKGDSILNIAHSISKSIIGEPLYHRTAGLYKKSGLFFKNYIDKFQFSNNLQNIVKELNLPIILNKIENSDFLSPLIIELGYLLKNFDFKLKS